MESIDGVKKSPDGLGVVANIFTVPELVSIVTSASIGENRSVKDEVNAIVEPYLVTGLNWSAVLLTAEAKRDEKIKTHTATDSRIADICRPCDLVCATGWICV